ncbi:MAG: anti-sigma factor, partial [Pirellulaceae bacterium]|nr:anti-sigma factor [Pirellulaceae bacterium]
ADHDRLLELLADRTLVGLDADEQQELESLLQANPESDAECLDRTAALLDLAAAAGDTEPLPEQLQDRLRADTRLGLPTRPGAGDGAGDPSYEGARGRTLGLAKPPHGRRMHWREAFAWLAAAACLLVAVFTWYARPTTAPPPNSPTVANSEPPVTTPGTDTPDPSTATLTVAQLREQLLASAPDVLHLQLVSNDGGAVARQPGGDIVWSSGRQMGYLRLQGLVNRDPPQCQYQLWIIGGDASSNEVINGGVFFVDRSKGELILPIQADQFVQQPKLFVISVETSGGGTAMTAPLLARADGFGP